MVRKMTSTLPTTG